MTGPTGCEWLSHNAKRAGDRAALCGRPVAHEIAYIYSGNRQPVCARHAEQARREFPSTVATVEPLKESA